MELVEREFYVPCHMTKMLQLCISLANLALASNLKVAMKLPIGAVDARQISDILDMGDLIRGTVIRVVIYGRDAEHVANILSDRFRPLPREKS